MALCQCRTSSCHSACSGPISLVQHYDKLIAEIHAAMSTQWSHALATNSQAFAELEQAISERTAQPAAAAEGRRCAFSPLPSMHKLTLPTQSYNERLPPPPIPLALRRTGSAVQTPPGRGRGRPGRAADCLRPCPRALPLRADDAAVHSVLSVAPCLCTIMPIAITLSTRESSGSRIERR
jgi:hypothetical protein